MRLFPSPKEGNLKIILLCIFTATTFWFFNALNKADYTTRINYPISFAYDHDSTYLLSQLPENITVQVSGGGWNLLRKTMLFDREPVEVSLDDPTQTKFITSQSITDLVENKLEDVRLDYIVTDTLFLNIDKAALKKVRLAVDTASLLLADQHRIVSNIQLMPNTAVLQGPASLIADTPDTIFVSLPDDEDEPISEDYSEELALSYNASEYIQIQPENIQLSFKVAPFSTYEKRIKITPVNFPEDSSVYLQQESVTISFWLQNNYVELANNYDFEVVANLRTFQPEDSTVTPALKSYPDFAKDITITPSKVKVAYAKSN